jgi:hypothetical protein
MVYTKKFVLGGNKRHHSFVSDSKLSSFFGVIFSSSGTVDQANAENKNWKNDNSLNLTDASKVHHVSHPVL